MTPEQLAKQCWDAGEAGAVGRVSSAIREAEALERQRAINAVQDALCDHMSRGYCPGGAAARAIDAISREQGQPRAAG